VQYDSVFWMSFTVGPILSRNWIRWSLEFFSKLFVLCSYIATQFSWKQQYPAISTPNEPL